MHVSNMLFYCRRQKNLETKQGPSVKAVQPQLFTRNEDLGNRVAAEPGTHDMVAQNGADHGANEERLIGPAVGPIGTTQRRSAMSTAGHPNRSGSPKRAVADIVETGVVAVVIAIV